MYAIVGAAGKIGFATAQALRKTGAPVTAVLRSEAKAAALAGIGCDIALADLNDPSALAWAIAGADAVQIILPPPLQSDDTPAEMRRSGESMIRALEEARPKGLLAISDYGAHVDDDIGMPTMFRVFERQLDDLAIPRIVLRSAEHMEGWAPFVAVAASTGMLPTLHHPVDATFPTVSASDVGMIAAELLLGAAWETNERIVHAEGPRRYSASDVADALSAILGRAVIAQPLPRAEWQGTLERVLSPSTAALVVRVYEAHNEGGLVEAEPGGTVRHGATEVIDVLRQAAVAA